MMIESLEYESLTVLFHLAAFTTLAIETAVEVLAELAA
jgi:hypothetical protein